jgi:hypothetical protein
MEQKLPGARDARGSSIAHRRVLVAMLVATALAACRDRVCPKMVYAVVDIDEAGIPGPAHPRCAWEERDRPECGPLPFNNEKKCYDPSRARAISSAAAAAPVNPADACTYDAECKTGWASVCERFDARPGQYILGLQAPGRTRDLAGHFCGCVRGGCRWFTQ